MAGDDDKGTGDKVIENKPADLGEVLAGQVDDHGDATNKDGSAKKIERDAG